MRKLPLALACAVILGTTNAHAMGMGELQVRSYLNQPLHAEIPISDVRSGDVDSLSVRLADDAAFERAGLSRAALAGRIQLRVEGGKRPRIILSSERPLRDPALGVVIQLSGPDGALVRDYAILLDPPGYQPVAPVSRAPVVPAVPAEAAAVTAPKTGLYGLPTDASARKAPTSRVIKDGVYVVAAGDTLYSLAKSVRPDGVSVQQAMDAIQHANPQAFTSSGMLMADATVRIPDAAAMRRLAAEAPVKSVDQVDSEAAAVTEVPADVVKEATPVAAPATQQAEVVPAVQEARLAIVQPAPQAATAAGVEPAPVVGEVVAETPATGERVAPGADMPVQMVEQIEAMRVENESLAQRISTLDSQMQKMEELLRLKDLQIKHLEQSLQDAGLTPGQPPAAKPVEKEEPSLLPTALLAVGGLGAVVLAFFLGGMRRRREETAALEDARVLEPAAVAPVAAATGAAVAVEQAEPAQAEEVMPSVAEAPPAPAMANPHHDALEEADVMLAYGLHDRALKVLDDAISRLPADPELQARKLRVLHEMGDREGFLAAAEAFKASFPNDEAWWPSIRSLGESQYADAPLFGGQAAEPPLELPIVESPAAPEVIDMGSMVEPLESLPLPEEIQPEPVPSVAAASSSVDEELLLPIHNLQFPGGPAPLVAAEMEPEPLELPPLELDLSAASTVVEQAMAEADASAVLPEEPGKAPETESVQAVEPLSADTADLEPVAKAEVATPEVSPRMGISEDDLMMLGIDLSTLNHEEEGVAEVVQEEVPAVALDLPQGEVGEEGGSARDKVLASFDEQAAKLDIAQAFIDMSDDDNARALLDEVMREGNDFLRTRAKEMLERMGA
ncbi:MAG: FimV/HubP family polar landmark protein [Pseudomonadota bacterium]